MYRFLFTIFFSLFFLSAATQIFATEHRAFSISLEELSGEAQYEIGGDVCFQGRCGTYGYFPISRLVFPVDVKLISLGAEFKLGIGTLTSKLKKDYSSDEGVFKDSDWMPKTSDRAPNPPSIYSESRSEANAFILSVDYEVKLDSSSKIINMFFGAGLTYQRFEFEARDTFQESSLPEFDVGLVPGLTITYSVDQYIPMPYFRLIINPDGNVELSVKAGYAPIVMIRDKDVHVVRDKVSTGDLIGESLEFELMLNFKLAPSHFVQLSYEYREVTAEGTQTQIEADGSSASIDEETISSQQSVAVIYRMEY